jgi:hypothetical protein
MCFGPTHVVVRNRAGVVQPGGGGASTTPGATPTSAGAGGGGGAAAAAAGARRSGSVGGPPPPGPAVLERVYAPCELQASFVVRNVGRGGASVFFRPLVPHPEAAAVVLVSPLSVEL